MLEEYKSITEIMEILREFIKQGMQINSHVALFSYRLDGKYIACNKSELLFDYIVENLKKYKQELCKNNRDEIKYIENQIKFFIKFIDSIKQDNVSPYQINRFFSFFNKVFESSSKSGKYTTIVDFVLIENNNCGISASGLFSILYNFYYSNIEVIYIEKYTRNKTKNIPRFNIHNPYIVTKLNNEFFKPDSKQTLNFNKINYHISSVWKRVIKSCDYEFITYAELLNYKDTVNLKNCMIRQILVNICEMTCDCLYDITQKSKDKYNLSEFYSRYINENAANDKQQIYYENKKKLRKYHSFKEKMRLYGKNIDIKNVTDFSYPFYIFGMENRKLFLKTESKLFNSKFREIFSYINSQPSSGALLYFLEYILGFHSIYLLSQENDKNTREKNLYDWNMIKEDIPPFLKIYMAIVIKSLRPVEKYMSSDEWITKIKNIRSDIIMLEYYCTMAVFIRLLYITDEKNINQILVGDIQDTESKKISLNKDLYDFLCLCDFPYDKPNRLNLTFYRALKKALQKQSDITKETLEIVLGDHYKEKGI